MTKFTAAPGHARRRASSASVTPGLCRPAASSSSLSDFLDPVPEALAERARAGLGPRPGGRPGPDVGGELPGRRRRPRPAPRRTRSTAGSSSSGVSAEQARRASGRARGDGWRASSGLRRARPRLRRSAHAPSRTRSSPSFLDWSAGSAPARGTAVTRLARMRPRRGRSPGGRCSSGALLRARDPQLPAVRGVEARASLPTHGVRFGDTVPVRLDVLVPSDRVDPSTVRLNASFTRTAPSGASHRRADDAGTTLLRYRFQLECLRAECLPERDGSPFLLPPALVTFRTTERGRAVDRLLATAGRLVAARPARRSSSSPGRTAPRRLPASTTGCHRGWSRSSWPRSPS